MDGQLFKEPVVERAVDFKFQRAEGVGDAFDGVFEAVSPVVHGIDAPLVARAVMGGMEDAVHDGIAEIDVRAGHVDLRAEDLFAIREFACAHAFEEIKILFDGAVAPRTFLAGLGQRATRFADLVCRLVIDVGEALLNHENGVFVHLFKIVGCVADVAFPIEAHPMDVLLDGVDIFDILLDGIRVVHAEHGLPLVVARDAEIDPQRLRMADVEVAVGFWREACADIADFVFAGRDVLIDDFTDKIRRDFFSRF